MAEYFQTKQWSLWIQPDGPNTTTYLLKCADLDDLTEPGQGIAEIVRCFRPDGSGWDTLLATYEPPDFISTTVTELMQASASWVEKTKEMGCEVPFYVNGAYCPPYDVFGNSHRSFGLPRTVVGSATFSNLTKREESGESTQAYELSAWPPLISYRAMTLARQVIAEHDDLNDVHFFNTQKCTDYCGSRLDICTYGVTCGNAPGAGSAAVPGAVYYTQDGGATWTICTQQPLTGTESAMSCVGYQIGANTYRLLVARDAAGANMEVFYSDDWGANWTPVIVATVAQGATREGALFCLDPYHIWLCLSGGYIYFSSDYGATWTEQSAGGVTASDLNEIWFSDETTGMCVGNAGAVLYTNDGGATWTAGTDPSGGDHLLCVTENAGGRIWWVGDSNADLWYSTDQGTTWGQRTFPGSGDTGEVTDVEFGTRITGFLLHDDTTPVGSVYRTRDGGFTWEIIPDVINAGLNSVHYCNANRCFAVGDCYLPAVPGTAVILKGSD